MLRHILWQQNIITEVNDIRPEVPLICIFSQDIYMYIIYPTHDLLSVYGNLHLFLSHLPFLFHLVFPFSSLFLLRTLLLTFFPFPILFSLLQSLLHDPFSSSLHTTPHHFIFVPSCSSFLLPTSYFRNTPNLPSLFFFSFNLPLSGYLPIGDLGITAP